MLSQNRTNGVLVRGRDRIHGGREMAPAQSRLDLYEWEAIWVRCWHRIRTWRVPARWSPSDWRDEARAEGLLAACQADREYACARGVPREAFFYQRIIARVWTRYRREWGYGRKLRNPHPIEECPTPEDSPATDDPDEVRQLLGRLREQDRWLIHQLFWDGKTEATLAADLGISQQAVNQRKSHALRSLQRQVGVLQ